MDSDNLNSIAQAVLHSAQYQDTNEFAEQLSDDCILLVYTSAHRSASALCLRAEGAGDVLTQQFRLCHWMRQGNSVAPSEVRVEPRRHVISILKSGRSAVDTTSSTRGGTHMQLQQRRSKSATTREGTVPTGGAAADANRSEGKLKAVGVVELRYGRPHCKIRDACTIAEASLKICLIERFLSAVPSSNSEGTDTMGISREQTAQDVEGVASPTSVEELRRILTSKTFAFPTSRCVVDYSFCNLREPMDLLRVTPVEGKRYLRRPTHQAAPASFGFGKPPASGHSQSAGSGATASARRLVIARNRLGESEAYEFEERLVLKDAAETRQANQDDKTIAELVQQLQNRYLGGALRLCNNSLTGGGQLTKVLRNLVANCYVALQWIDLSYNTLTQIPDLSAFPLTTLHLHGNRISSWSAVELRVCTLPLLHSVTLYGNPIATADESYRSVALAAFINVRAGTKGAVALKSLDFTALSSCDIEVAKTLASFGLSPKCRA